MRASTEHGLTPLSSTITITITTVREKDVHSFRGFKPGSSDQSAYLIWVVFVQDVLGLLMPGVILRPAQQRDVIGI
jgi:hypothetical protein